MDARMPRKGPPAWPILIAGGGLASQVFGLALARSLGRAVRVTICDPNLERPRATGRAYALSPATVLMLDALDVALAEALQPIAAMTITDGKVEEPVRQTYLSFGETESGPLGFMMEDEALRPALESAARGAGVAFEATGIASFEAREDRIDVVLGSGERCPACLLVAADGARSRLREAAGIAWFGRAYPQAGLVAAVRHRHPHRGRAIQHFLPEGPFAILPLVDGPDGAHRSSIVWTERQARVAEILALAPEAALDAVAARVGRNLDPVSLDTPLAAFPLGFGLARSFVAPRFALLGDSAHEIHPLAGQGLNLGLGDAAALAERIADAVRLGIDPGSPDVLAAYERDRRFDAVALAGATDSLNRLFSNDILPIRALRDLGLGFVDRSAPAKGFFARAASGQTARAPRLMRGEPL